MESIRAVIAKKTIKAPFTGRPTLYLYDAVPGGVGLTERLFGLTLLGSSTVNNIKGNVGGNNIVN